MKTIRVNDNAKLVEYIDTDGFLQRVILPVDEFNIELGMPYGVDFSRFIKHPAIANELRKRGLWTIEDLEKNRNAALGAVQAAYNQDLATIIKLAKKEEANNG